MLSSDEDFLPPRKNEANPRHVQSLVRCPSWGLSRIDSSATGSTNKLDSSYLYFTDGPDQDVNVYVIDSEILTMSIYSSLIGFEKARTFFAS